MRAPRWTPGRIMFAAFAAGFFKLAFITPPSNVVSACSALLGLIVTLGLMGMEARDWREEISLELHAPDREPKQ